MTTTLPSNNQGAGFYGGIGEDAPHLWREAFTAVTDATKARPEAVREFLDSIHGQYFADDVNNSTLDDAIARWTTIGGRTSDPRDYGVAHDGNMLDIWVGYYGDRLKTREQNRIRQARLKAKRTSAGHIRREYWATPREHDALTRKLEELRHATD